MSQRRPAAPARRNGVALGLFLLLATAACGRGGSPPATPPAKPAPPGAGQVTNVPRPAADAAATVLLITVDTLRADRLGCYGRADAGTPALDFLAAQGARFAEAHATAPLTLPSHTSLLSGRSLPAHGVHLNGTYAVPDTIPLIAEHFQTGGYATGAFISSPVLARRHGLARGFDVYDDTIPPPPRRTGTVSHYPERAGALTVARAADWLAAQSGKPAFVWVHLWEPHAPYAPPPEFAGRFADGYQGEVAAADAAIGALLSRTSELGRARLLVVATSDHGESLGEHGEATHGVYLYRAVLHVPLLIYGPAFGVQPAILREPASLADVAPTLLEFAGLPALPYTDGVSFATSLRGGGAVPPRPGVFAESHLPLVEFGWSGLRAFVGRTHKLIEAPRPELYESGDHAESLDLARSRQGELADLSRALADAVRRGAGAAEGDAETHASAEELERLRSLGYAATGRSAPEGPLVDRRRADPKDRREFLGRYDRAIALADAGQIPQALPEFAVLEQQDPRNLDLLLRYGQALIVAGRHDEALALMRRAVEVDPAFALAWYRLGQLLDARRDLAGAEAAYRKSVAADPLAVDPRKALAGLLGERGDLKSAIALLEESQRLDPNDRAIVRDLEAFRARAGRAPSAGR